MSDAEKKDKGDHAGEPLEKPSLQTSDAQQSRNASANEVENAQKANPNASDGSLRHYQTPPLTAAERVQRIADQDKSLELIDYSGPGKEVIVASRALGKDLPATTSHKANNIQEKANALEPQSTGSNIDPVFEPVLKLKQHAETLAPGQERDRLLKLAEEQAAELKALPLNKELKAAEILQVKVIENEIDRPPLLANHLDGWLTAGQAIAALPAGQQFKVIGSALVAGLEQYQYDQNERTLGQLIGTVEGLGEVSVNLAKIVDFGGAILFNDEKVASTIGEEFGTSLGQTIVGGIKLFETSHNYLFDLGYTGDYAKPFRDVAAIGNALNEHWDKLPPREQERLKYKLITELTADAIIGGGSAQAIGKAKKLTEILDVIAGQAGKSAGKTLEKSKKAVQSIADTVNQSLGPEYATAGGGRLRGVAASAEDIGIDLSTMEKRVFVSKLDPTHRLRPIEAARENSRLKGHAFDEEEWKKLKPEEKAKQLADSGYQVLENPEPRQPIDSTKLDLAFRGDRDIYTALDRNGLRKSHINEAGDLVPANAEGVFNGKEVNPAEHIVASKYPNPKNNSPFTSVGTNGVIWKYGDGKGIKIDMKSLREEINSGKATGIEIIEHSDLIKAIQQSELSDFDKRMALRFAGKDNEFLIKGTVPKRFLKDLGDN